MKSQRVVWAMMGIWLAGVLIVMQLSTVFIFPQTNFLGIGFATPLTWSLWPLANFDGEHYLAVASRGYREYEFAFFPVYPLLINLLSRIVGDVLIAGLMLSVVLTGLMLWLMVKLFEFDYSRVEVIKGLVLLLSFPSAFYFGSVYSEALFLCLVVGSFLAIRQQRLVLGSLLGLMAAMTRLVGVVLWPALVLSNKLKNGGWFWLIPLGTIGVLVLDYILAGNALAFIAAQPKFNSTRTVDGVIFLPQVIWRYLKIITTTPVSGLAFWVALQELVISLLVVGLLLRFWRRIRREYWIFSLGAIMIPTLTGTLSSMPRYVLAAFPLFFVVARLVKNNYLFALIVVIMIVLQIANLALFANGYFIA